jgi:hypothetical protein
MKGDPMTTKEKVECYRIMKSEFENHIKQHKREKAEWNKEDWLDTLDELQVSLNSISCYLFEEEARLV